MRTHRDPLPAAIPARRTPFRSCRPCARSACLAVVGLGAALLLGACRAPIPKTPTANGAREKALYEAVLRDLARQDGAAGLNTEVLEAQAARFAEVVAWNDAGELRSGVQHFWAGATLVRSDEPAHLLLAESLGMEAAMRGEPRGRLVQAEARDRTAVLVGEPQPYGTQSVFVPITGKWRLYAVDPRTTDEERRAMGLPSLAEFEARTEARNDTALTKRLRDELVRPGSLWR